MKCKGCGSTVINLDHVVMFPGIMKALLMGLCFPCYKIQQASLEHPSVETNAKRATNEEEKR